MSKQDDIKKFKELSVKLDMSVGEELALIEEARREKKRKQEEGIYSAAFLRNVFALILLIILFIMIVNQMA